MLESIYLEELRVRRGCGRSVPGSPPSQTHLSPRFWVPEPGAARRSEPWEVSITLHPATAQDQDSQFVCCTLLLAVPPQVGPGQRWAPPFSLPLSSFSSFFLGFVRCVLF